ncbi:MAG: NAD(P)/FAD-dependent oxidoreductase [Clostridia bacterium]|nr:NAD(P)/FAD-dependent oxidoreductase [Clostridia bacterium]
MSDTVVVIGGGPAGMMSAIVAAARGKSVILIEKNDSLGRKLLITGKGRCNITNDCDISDFIPNVPVNGNFLYSAFYSFTNRDLISMLEKAGLQTKVERGGRVFPVSDKAIDVLNALKRLLKHYGVRVVRAEVNDIKVSSSCKEVVVNGNRVVRCNSVIIATGGISYPKTGSTGDGYRFAGKLGHTVTELKGSLVPLNIKSPYIPKLMGLSLKNTAVKVYRDSQQIYDDFGEMLFTHYGVSGPVILSASSHMRNFKNHTYELIIDLKPALDNDTLDKRILRDFIKEKNKMFINSLDDLLPKKMIPVVVEMTGIDPQKQVNEITREERKTLLTTLKKMRFKVDSLRPVSDAIITSGGVSVKEINPKTMESKLCPGVYFAGEVIDVDAYTGGFNLQIAFSTGYLAGKNV